MVLRSPPPVKVVVCTVLDAEADIIGFIYAVRDLLWLSLQAKCNYVQSNLLGRNDN